ncbi:MAG: aminopeptidase P family protein [Chloroflexota bacterium]
MNTADRLSRLRRKLKRKKIGALLVSQPENRYYLSGFIGSSGYLFITGQQATLATDFRYLEQAKKEAPDYRLVETRQDLSWLADILGGTRTRRLGFEEGYVTVAQHRQLSDALKKARPGLELVPSDGLVERLRIIKEPGEIELIRRAADLARAAFEYAGKIIEAGVPEQRLAWLLETFLREGGSQVLPFEVIVASGPNAAMPHARPSERPIQAGEPIIIDIGARFGGYCSDMTRTFCIGTPDQTYQRVYDTVRQAQQAAISAVRELATGQEVDSAARKVIEAAGYGAAFGHALGHGVGLAVHEPPRLGPGSQDRIKTGMVFTIEPGVYLPGWGGIRLEDDILVASGSASVI